MDQHERIGRIIQEYDEQGWHRTGTEIDHESARWLLEQARERGLDGTLETFKLSRIDPELSYIETDGHRVEGLPLFDGSFTDREGIRGRLGLLGSNAEIGLTEIETGKSDQHETAEAARRTDSHKALVMVTVGRRPGLVATNASSFLAPFGPPVLQVSDESRRWLAEHAGRGSEARLVASVSRVSSESFNVVARLRGRDENLAPLVITTPRSGWWHCAGERGGGIACWLEVMQAVHEARPPRDVIFLATSAHELGVQGIDVFLEKRPGILKEALLCLHFGASIGAAQEPNLRFSATDDGLERRMIDALASVGADAVPPAPRGTVVGAESRTVVTRGARCIAMAGHNALFHLEADRWPDAVDVEAVAGFSNAFADVAAQLAGDSP